MDRTEVNGSESSTPDDLERPSKRQKKDIFNNSAQETTWNFERRKRKREFIQSALCEIEAHERSLEQERNRLKIQVQLDTEKMARLQEDLKKAERDKEEVTAQLQEDLERSRKDGEKSIAQLQGNLENLMRDLEEVRRSQKSTESQFTQLMTIIEENIMPMVMDSSSEDTLTASQFQEEGQESIPEGLAEVTLRNDSISQEKLSTQDIPLTKPSIAIQAITPEKPTDGEMKALEAKAKRVDELEEELQIARATILSLHEVRSQQQSSMQERIDEAEKVRQQMKILGKKLEMSSSKICEDESMHNSSGGGEVEMANSSVASPGGSSSSVASDRSGTLLDQDHNEAQEASSETSEKESSPSNDEPDFDEASAVMQQDGEQQHNYQEFLTDEKYSVLVDPRFFAINWNEEFIRPKKKFICCKCTRELTTLDILQDHVWTMHYSGVFQCPYCTDSRNYLRKSSVKRHIKNIHTEL